MQSIRSVLFTAAAITITLVAFVFAAIIAVGSAIAAKLNGRPVHARAGARANPGSTQREMRVWNDGRGTIIDL